MHSFFWSKTFFISHSFFPLLNALLFFGHGFSFPSHPFQPKNRDEGKKIRRFSEKIYNAETQRKKGKETRFPFSLFSLSRYFFFSSEKKNPHFFLDYLPVRRRTTACVFMLLYVCTFQSIQGFSRRRRHSGGWFVGGADTKETFF